MGGNSREKMLAAIGNRENGSVPCCFMSFTALRKRHGENMFELCKAELGMGLDSMLFIPTAPRSGRIEHPDLRGLPVRFEASVSHLTSAAADGHGLPMLTRRFSTPSGDLSTSVKLSDDWPHGEHVPFIDDYQIPRAVKPLIGGREDLPALRHLLALPTAEDVAGFREEARIAHDFVQRNGVLLVGGWGVGWDMANWLCGMETLMVKSIEDAGFAAELMEMIHGWNLARMKVVLEGEIDLYIRRGWYEGAEFVPPEFHRRILLPQLAAEADLAHSRGSRFGYICTSGVMPFVDSYRDAGIDLLIGVDPIQDRRIHLDVLRRKAGEKICLWGGVSGAITVEQGDEEDVRAAVREAIRSLGPRGFVLSPVDNITVDAPRTWRNVKVFIDEWEKRR